MLGLRFKIFVELTVVMFVTELCSNVFVGLSESSYKISTIFFHIFNHKVIKHKCTVCNETIFMIFDLECSLLET